MFNRTKVFGLILAGLLILTLLPGGLTAAAPPEPPTNQPDAEAPETQFGGFSAPALPAVVEATAQNGTTAT